MNKQLLIIWITILLLVISLSGCTSESPVSKGNVSFSIVDVTVTSELEIEQYFTNETKIEFSNDTKYVIISITIENKENKWLAVQTTPTLSGLIDDEGNEYIDNMFVRINNSTYSIEQINSIDENETLYDDISPNSTELKKIVFTIPIERIPDKLILDYGFRANELTNVEDWFDIELQLPS